MKLFNRTVQVTLTKGEKQVSIRNLDMEFSIEKSGNRDPNTCNLTIFNLAARTRAEFQELPVRVAVDAGYDGETALMFDGDVRWADSKRVGPDWITIIEAGDGDRASRARVAQSFKPGVKTRTILEACAKRMGLRLPQDLTGFSELRKQFASGFVLSGKASDEFERVLAARGLQWSIQNGRLQVLRPGQVNRERAVLVSQDTGLVGVPDYRPPSSERGKPKLNFQMFLHPSIIPKGRLQVSTMRINGAFRAERVLHSGATFGQEFYTYVESEAI